MSGLVQRKVLGAPPGGSCEFYFGPERWEAGAGMKGFVLAVTSPPVAGYMMADDSTSHFWAPSLRGVALFFFVFFVLFFFFSRISIAFPQLF